MPIKKYVDETVFDCINTEEKAYWLGFIFADGNIANAKRLKEINNKASYRLEVSLQSSDIDHLNKLKTFFKWEGVVKISKTNYKRKDRCRLYFNNKHIWETLNAYGCTPNKSLTLKFPNIEIFENKELIKHFIRGYIDGDGCISYLQKDHTKMSLSLLGTVDMLTNIQKHLPIERPNKIWLTSGSIIKPSNVYTLSFNLWRGYYVTKYLYENSTIYLNRKYEKYVEYCRLYEKS